MAAFVVDEDISYSVATTLRSAGHDAVHVREVGLQGAADPDVFRLAQVRRAALITEDLGFADIRAYPVGTHPGIIVLRMPENVPYHLRSVRLLEVIEAELAQLAGSLLIIEPSTVRRRSPEA